MIVSVKKLLSTIAILSVFSPVFAGEENSFSYDYVEGGYAYWNVVNNSSSSSDQNFDGGRVKVSYAITDGIHIFSSYHDIDPKGENRDGLHFTLNAIGLGIHRPIYKDTDIVVDFSRMSFKAKLSNRDRDTGQEKIDTLDIGVRYRLSNDTELTASIQWEYPLGDDDYYHGAGIGVIKDISKDYSVNLNIASLERKDGKYDWNRVFLGVRYNY